MAEIIVCSNSSFHTDTYEQNDINNGSYYSSSNKNCYKNKEDNQG